MSMRRMSSRYPALRRIAAAVVRPMWVGQPPMATRSAKSSTEMGSACPRCGSPASSPARDIPPLEWPLSNSDMGRIRSRVKRPAPVCRVMSSDGTADPVRMNCPGVERSSTARRTWFQRFGATCHSSSSRGGLAGEHRGRVDVHHALRGDVDVEHHLAGAGLRRGRGFAHRPSAFDQHCAGRFQQLSKLRIGDPWAVGGVLRHVFENTSFRSDRQPA